MSVRCDFLFTDAVLGLKYRGSRRLTDTNTQPVNKEHEENTHIQAHTQRGHVTRFTAVITPPVLYIATFVFPLKSDKLNVA